MLFLLSYDLLSVILRKGKKCQTLKVEDTVPSVYLFAKRETAVLNSDLKVSKLFAFAMIYL